MGGMKKQDFAPSSISKNSPKRRLYQVWKGRNKFLCGGRLVFGPDGGSVLLSTFLIGGPALTFCIKMLLRIQRVDMMYEHVIFIVGLILTVLDLLFLFMTSARNPGIVPRNSKPPEVESMHSCSSVGWFDSRSLDLKLPRTRDVYVNGYMVRVKYCDTCLLYRPPRASHCSICNNCVQRFDHHCPWVGQCIGVRNYRTFIMFITTSTALCIYVFTCSLLNLLREPVSLWTSMSRDIVSVLLIVYCFISVWFVGGLSVFHFYLMCTNQTTYENFRYRYDKKENPYNRGVFNNLKEVLFSKTTPSLVNFREWVIEEDETYLESISKKFGGENLKVVGKVDLEQGIIGKDGKPHLDILQNLDYKERDESLKKDNKGGKIYDSFFYDAQDDKYDTTDSTIDDDGTEVSCDRSSSAVLRK